MRLAGFRKNLQRAIGHLFEAGHRVIERKADAVLFQVALDEAGGLWKEFRPEDLATPEAFERDPRLVWEWYGWRLER